MTYWAPTDLGSSSFSGLSFCLFILFMGFSRQEYWSGLPFSSPVDHILSRQGYGFSSGHIQMWELDYKEGWAPKNWCFWTVVLEKTLESPLDCKAIQPVHPKGDQSWVFFGRTDVEDETPILWPPDVKSWLLEKTLMLGKIEGRRRRGRQRMQWLDGMIDSMDMGWVDSGTWWWTGRPGMPWFMGWQRIGHYWVTELNWATELNWTSCTWFNLWTS